MRALGRVVGNNFTAIGALARVGRRRRRSRHETIDLLNQNENCSGDDEEVQARIEERAVSDDWCARFFGGGEGFVLNARKIDIEI